LITGSGMGIALASILFPAFNQTVWQRPDPGRALDWKKLAVLIGIIAVVDVSILLDIHAVLYLVSFVSVLGVLALLTLVFSMAWLLIMQQENAFNHLREMWMPLLAGTTLAFLMITAIDLLRLSLTGTWGGFPLG
jgi:flagellar biosynthesis protein FlhB